MSRSYQRPENALKRAHEFIDVSKSMRALEVLYEVIKKGKMRTNYSEKVLEPIMFKYLELCVDLRKSHLAKEGLYQYRNIFQSISVSSLETVVRRYLQMAEERAEAARKESHQAVVDIDDLDQLATPEEILLSAVSWEDAQDRSDRTILTPWVKFLWESYRQCLELLRTNARVERLYHDIAKQAFRFCEKYARKTEFRKLCDNLRIHLTHLAKQQGTAAANVVNLSNSDTQQLNMETRLEQLNYAIRMELWQEAYKAIEDIHELMQLSKKLPKPHMMANYYGKLALVFWKAGNYLFHAAALFKLFQLLREQKKNITPEEVSKRASVVLLATLAIPLPSAHPEFDRFIETEKSAQEKVDRLATLLSLTKPPKRLLLIKDLQRYNVVAAVPPELQQLYNLMEVEFDPLHLCPRMQTILTWINDNENLGLTQYVEAVQTMTITRLVKQVAQVYQTISFDRLLSLSVFVTPHQLERILVDLVRHNDLQIRIDHRTECVHFGKDLSESQREDLPEGPTLQTMPSENIRCQLVEMASALNRCVTIIKPDKKEKEMENIRAHLVQVYKQTREREHNKLLQRHVIIEKRKEMLETQTLEREEQIRRQQEEQLVRQKQEEQQRLEREACRREQQRQEEQIRQIQTKQIKDKLAQISQTSYGQRMMEKLDEKELLTLDAEEILQRQVEELEKERKELQQRLKSQEKKVDYNERAKRLVEIPLLKADCDRQREKDKEFWEAEESERVERLVEEHRVSLEHSQRMERMRGDRDYFLEMLKTARRSEIQKKLTDFNARLEVERKKRLAERKEQRRRERREAWVKQREEEKQQKLDEELKQQREDAEREEREAREKEEMEYERKRAEIDRQAEIQREREREIEMRQREREEQERSGRDRDNRENRDRDNRENRDRDNREGGDSWRRGGAPPPADTSDSQPQEERKAWRPGHGVWREKEREKADAWRLKESEERDDHPRSREASPEGRPPPRTYERDRGDTDIRKEGGRDRGDRDIRRDMPPRERGDMDRRRDQDSRRDQDRGGPRDDFERRDQWRGSGSGQREDRFERRAPDRDFRRGEDRGDVGRRPPPDRGSEDGWRSGTRAPPARTQERDDRGPRREDRGGPRDRDDRGPPRDFRDRDDRGPPPRDRDDRGPPRGGDRDDRGPLRENMRGGPRDRDDRGSFRDGPRGGAGGRDGPRGGGLRENAWRGGERGPPRGEDRAPPRGDDRAPPRGDDRAPPRGDDRAPPRGGDDRAPPRGGDDRAPPRGGEDRGPPPPKREQRKPRQDRQDEEGWTTIGGR